MNYTMIRNTYLLKESDSFYYNWNVTYLPYKNYIVAIKYVYENTTYPFGDLKQIMMSKFDSLTMTSSENVELKYVEHDQLQDVSGSLLRYGYYAYLFDFENQTYGKTCQFPYGIHEIDGNYITTCQANNKIYWFHSSTSDYETGVFIYDIENDKFNEGDFMLTNEDTSYEKIFEYEEPVDKSQQQNHTNRFKSLHDMEISSCCVYNNEIYVLYDNHFTPNKMDKPKPSKIAKYDPNTDQITEIINEVVNGELYACQNKFIISISYHYSETKNTISFCDVESKKIVKGFNFSDDKWIKYAQAYENKIIMMRETWENPYGQIYKENHDDDCKIRNMEIVIIDSDGIKE